MGDLTVTAKNLRPQKGVDTLPGTAGEALQMGQWVYKASDGDMNKTDANAAVSSEAAGMIIAVPQYPMANVDAAVSEAITVVRRGIVGGFTGLTPGAKYYLSETPGVITDVEPAGAGTTWVKAVAEAWSATELFIDVPMTPAAAN